MALKGGGRPEPSSLLEPLLCAKSSSNHHETCVCQQDTVTGQMGVHRCITVLRHEVAVSSREAGQPTGVTWSTGWRRRLKQLSAGFRLRMLFVPEERE